MPIIFPNSAGTFGDSTKTMGSALSRKYVLAQFRCDANFDWVRELRAHLVRDELKYPDLRANEPKLRQDRILWPRVENGVGQASIIVIDTNRIHGAVVSRALRDGADLQDLENDIEGMVDECATALVSGTPIAYLPHSLARVVPWASLDLMDSLERFTPTDIRARIGGGLTQAQIFAARAHAVFDLASAEADTDRTIDVFGDPLARVMLSELLATPRGFDIEAPNTLPVLNEAAQVIARAVSQGVASGEIGPAQLVREVDSRARDELQAADVAAGYARELLEIGGENALPSRFERVWINGRRLRR
jgi:hypothetical protein